MKLNSYFSMLIFFCTTLVFGPATVAQTIYNMSNMTVTECKGILLDSENGSPTGAYDHNENYTFSICIPGAPQITLEFDDFCTEEPFMGMYFDYMRFYDGPDTLSPQIGGIYSGITLPPDIVATSGCLTVNFISDANVACTGWEASWEVEVPEPIPPNILPITDVECDESSLSVRFDLDVPCSAITAGAFVINGPLGVSVTNATPVACSGGMTREANIEVAPPFSVSGDYTIVFTMEETDICQEVHILTASAPFQVVNCPLFVSLELANDPICAGSCTFLTALATGGFIGTYDYSWDPPAPNARRIEICPDFPTTYSVTVTDQQGGTAEASILVNPLPAPVIEGGNQVLCQSDEPFNLMASIPGGTWSGFGISPAAAESGLYDPGLVSTVEDTVRYVDGNGCEAMVIFRVTSLDEGTDDAACPSSAPFYVSGGLPAGGEWTGPNIAADGLFTPPAIPGTFEVTYTHPNGCAGTKTIEVGDILFPPSLDTLCQSDTIFQIPITPFGGIWSGNGIIDEDLGLFDPAEAEPGENKIFYAINGCEDSLSLFIKGIDAFWDLSACPAQNPFILPGNWGPPGGVWDGPGILDASTGLYDPSISGDGNNDTLRYSFDGCVDERVVYVRTTDVDAMDNLEFCTDSEPFTLNRGSVGTLPSDGTWTGTGIVQQNDTWYFRADLAGPGVYSLVYEANTCSDSISVTVFQAAQIIPEVFCELEAPRALQTDLPGGEWSGAGIIDADTGIFDPGVAGAGTHQIFYDTPDGCTAQMEVIVDAFADAEIINLGASFCHRDTTISIQTTPPGGTVSIDGQVGSVFNPIDLGIGMHTVHYKVGIGDCLSEVTQSFQIGQALAVSLPFTMDSICYGFNIRLSAEGSGGESLNGYTYTWDQGLGFGKEQLVSPTTTTTYTVVVEDGCSDPVSASITIIVHPEIEVAYTTGPKVCRNDTTSATIISPAAEGDFSFIWNSVPPTLDNTISSQPTTYSVIVSNQITGCEVEEEISLPGFPPVTANFGVSPNGECISSLEPEINILDFSVGGVRGRWEFGDESVPERYNLGESLVHSFENPGEYTITLSLENEGGCTSEHKETVCIQPDHRIFAPNAITPNYDGLNDFFQFKGLSIEQIEWHIYNRFGQLLYAGSGMDDRWDGLYKGIRVLEGVYTYIARYRTIHDDKEQTIKGFVTVIH